MTVEGPFIQGDSPHYLQRATSGSIQDMDLMQVASDSGAKIVRSLSESESIKISWSDATPVKSHAARVKRSQSVAAKSPEDRASISAINHLLSGETDFSKFNKIADSLKKGSNWILALRSQAIRMSDKQLMFLANIPEVDLRGCDRELLLSILMRVRENLVERQAIDDEALAVLDQKIKNLETRILTVDPGTMTRLGGGAVNTVYLVKYPDESGEGEVEAVFKPDPSELDSLTVFKEQHFGTAAASGIPPGKNAHLACRAVASSFVDELLYGTDVVSVKTEFAIVNGQRGILMQKATGKSPKIIGIEKEVINLNEHKGVRQFMVFSVLPKGRIDAKDLKMLAALLKYRDMELVGDLAGKWQLVGINAHFQHFDPRNPTTAEGLVKLQVKDIITGECDRHPENYFVDAVNGGKVTGIDEDCCFGVNAIPEDVDVREQPTLKGIIPNNASLMLRMPPVITQEIKEAIEQLSANSNQLIHSLGPLISREEILATLVRLEKLRRHVNDPSACMIVQSKEELLSTEALEKINTNNSYWARERLVFSHDEKGWNYLRAHRTI